MQQVLCYQSTTWTNIHNNNSHACFVYLRVSRCGRLGLGTGTSSTRMSHPGCGGGSNAPGHGYTELYFSCACFHAYRPALPQSTSNPPRPTLGLVFSLCCLFSSSKLSGLASTSATHLPIVRSSIAHPNHKVRYHFFLRIGRKSPARPNSIPALGRALRLL